VCVRLCKRVFERARARVCACVRVRMCLAAHVVRVQRAHVHRRRCSWQPLPHAHVAPAFCCLASSRFTDVTCITCHSQSIGHRLQPCSMLLVQSVCNFSGNCVVRYRYTCSSSHTGAVEVPTPLPSPGTLKPVITSHSSLNFIRFGTAARGRSLLAFK